MVDSLWSGLNSAYFNCVLLSNKRLDNGKSILFPDSGYVPFRFFSMHLPYLFEIDTWILNSTIVTMGFAFQYLIWLYLMFVIESGSGFDG